MVLPLYKVLSLVIRVFSKPLITYTKQAHLKNDAVGSSPMIRKAFVWLGNSYHRGQTWVNRKFMKIQTQFAYKPLNDQLAIEKGIEFFYELMFYSLMIGLPLYEMIRGAEESAQKSRSLQEKLKKIDDQFHKIHEKQEQCSKLQEQISRISKESQLKPQQAQPNNQSVKISLKQESPLIFKQQSSTQTESTQFQQTKNQISHSSFSNTTTPMTTQKLQEIKNNNLHIETLKMNINGKTHVYHFYYNPTNNTKASNII